MNRYKDPSMKEVKVGGIVYAVLKDKDLQSSRDVVGIVNYKTCQILLDDSMSEQTEDSTLIHEITHCILVEAGYNEHEEDLANRIGLILYQVLKDNDFSWLYNKNKQS